MFRRLPSGLPKDPKFEPTLEGLGYFINEKDEIRSIENPKAYFKFFLTKNDRYNQLHREAMNHAIRDIVMERLLNLGLQKVLLPLNVTETSPHIHILTSSNLSTASRVIILFYEPKDDIGIFAHRILGGAGGINTGSAVNIVKYIQEKGACSEESEPPAIILANMGQIYWYRRGQKPVTLMTWSALPQSSCVEKTTRLDAIKNTVPGNRTTDEHIDYIFNHVIEELMPKVAKIDVIGVSEGAMGVSRFLDDLENWKKWGSRMQALAALATWWHSIDYKNPLFLKWLEARGRIYMNSPEPEGTYLAGPHGTRHFRAFGSPVFSLGESYYTECLLPKGYHTVIDFFHEVADWDSQGGEYVNPTFVRIDGGEEDYEDMGFGDEGFGDEERKDGVELKIEKGEDGDRKEVEE
ncbi:hypothetical protein SS1G_09155 [Sclerotinia sclerotiorum 1980 UF-70]|uniref:Arb2 domain-containing protein n=2 Tax=Sclerotinia sclerotiorum (strain ATCC 18683 / 1980 / Ss-1) TaxID=665079 RepID=A7EUZ7_SCLS1|nr:hypothetical protein SS1G_09155 [Sclerotinia sclerotiorum 1980 UF-70]APA15947.1 hypothetical protein sscle_15g107170 [Sclerotinia sclerotiorum 1980 UF-70]EDN93289.1 hypothetical protein SS1G_09155 [Sclerotinia sclerotiorum 1980 UF-70]